MKKKTFAKVAYQSLKSIFKLTNQCDKFENYLLFEDFCQSVEKTHFNQEGLSREEKKAFFKKQLKNIEIETHAFCNRTCSFCPNSQINRLNKNQIMPVPVFNKIISELELIDYRNVLKLHRYNEPLALDIIFDRISYARRQLPHANIGIHSNGDYVTKEMLLRLEEDGLNFLQLSLYIDFNGAKEEQFYRAKEYCEDYLKKRNLKGQIISADGRLIRYIIPMQKMYVSMFVANADVQWVDRGGVVKKYSNQDRISPCEGPFNGMFIDWTGDVLPCCNLRGDIALHKEYILGNAAESTLQEIFYSKIANALRRELIEFKEKTNVCKTCQYGIFHLILMAKLILNKKLKEIGIS
ncbi:MAG: radical SAM/SPASM domain-containing protein [Candidatus Omnitrophota bacterium]